ncbi:MAG: ribonuclease R [Saprospiraceae bacterium]
MVKKKKSSTKGKKLSVGDLRREITRMLRRDPKKRFNAKQIIKKLKIFNSSNSVNDALQKLVEKKVLIAHEGYKFQLSRNTAANGKSNKEHEGVVDMTRTGAAYIVCDDLEKDVYVPAKYTNTALNGDRVRISVFVPHGRRKPEGKVISVVSRSRDSFIGELRLTKKYATVFPDPSNNMPVDIFVKLSDLKGAKEGDKVVVRVTKWPTKATHSPTGVITTVLGAVGSSDIEMKSILINNGFNLTFPDAVIEQSERLVTDISEEEIALRRDLRDVTTFTIDPDTAKDFDDALSIQYLENGHCEIGVHIADVSHYVEPNTALDREAYSRSTSVYLVDRVLPMLPEKISNELCSLRPHEDKRTFSAIFTFDEKDKLVDRWFGKTLTHSDRRFTYEEAQMVIELGKGDFAKEIEVMNRIAKKLRKAKFSNGAIAFESEEVKFRLDEEGTPIDVYVKERKEAHMLIEDFMLLANKEVAKFIAKRAKREVPFVYRVHDIPNAEKVEDFARFAAEMGVKMDISTPQKIASSYNKLSKAARTNDELKVLEPLAIRTMSKAIYTTENIGHYGLAFEYYSHFTSPIRRYSDVLTHRILEKNLDQVFITDKETLEDKCKHISSQERKAMQAERESVKYKQVEFIEKMVGEEFEGVISGIIERGFFVELKANKCEGMVGFDQMDESFNIEEGRLRMKGNATGKVYKMGDSVTVRILSADLSKRQIEMALSEQ